MLRIIDTAYNLQDGQPLNCDTYYVKKKTDGIDELIFTLSINDPIYWAIKEQTRIEEDDNAVGIGHKWVIKAIDAGEKKATIKCQYNLEEWQTGVYLNFALETTFAATVSHVLPTGWTLIDNSGDTSTQRVEFDACTQLDVVKKCQDLWPNITVRFNNVLNRVVIQNMNTGTNKGSIISRELNLKKLTYKGKSANFANRLIPLGKDGLTISDVNGGNYYIDNFSYSDRLVCGVWQDEKIEDANELLSMGQQVLAEVSVPERSYSCDIADLAQALPGEYGWLSFDMFDQVTIIDDTRGYAKFTYKVAELWIYPYMPQKNKVVLSSTAPKIQTQVRSLAAKIQADQNNLFANLGEMITTGAIMALGNNGYVRVADTDGDGMLDTIYIQDNVDPSASNMVIRIDNIGIFKSTNGISGTFRRLIAWNGTNTPAILDDANLRIYYSTANYTPQTITYMDDQNVAHTISVLGYIAP